MENTKTTITLVVYNHDLEDLTMHGLRHLLMDALAEFVAHRANGHAEAYVNERYPGEAVYPQGEARNRKIADTLKRIKWANALHSADVQQIAFEPDTE